MTRKIIVFGSRGQVGQSLMSFDSAHNLSIIGFSHGDIDITKERDVIAAIQDYDCDLVINAAAYTNVDGAEGEKEKAFSINFDGPAILAQACCDADIPLIHISTDYVFDGMKKLGYNENDDTNPQGVYGLASLQGERAVRQHNNHIVIRSGWLFGKKKKGLIKSWIRAAKINRGQVPVTSRRLSPTYTGHLAQAILAVIQQVDCDANVWGTYHYSGLETKREIEFVEQVIKYAANDDEPIYKLLDSINIVEQDVHAPEIFNSTLSSKKIFDTFGIKQKSWHGDLQEVIKTLYEGVYRSEGTAPENESTESDAA